LSTSQPKALCTLTKADAACIISPRLISPQTYFGAQSRTGKIGAICALPCEIIVVRMYCTATSRQRPMT
jgi:hypothetical protein